MSKATPENEKRMSGMGNSIDKIWTNVSNFV